MRYDFEDVMAEYLGLLKQEIPIQVAVMNVAKPDEYTLNVPDRDAYYFGDRILDQFLDVGKPVVIASAARGDLRLTDQDRDEVDETATFAVVVRSEDPVDLEHRILRWEVVLRKIFRANPIEDDLADNENVKESHLDSVSFSPLEEIGESYFKGVEAHVKIYLIHP